MRKALGVGGLICLLGVVASAEEVQLAGIRLGKPASTIIDIYGQPHLIITQDLAGAAPATAPAPTAPAPGAPGMMGPGMMGAGPGMMGPMGPSAPGAMGPAAEGMGAPATAPTVGAGAPFEFWYPRFFTYDDLDFSAGDQLWVYFWPPRERGYKRTRVIIDFGIDPDGIIKLIAVTGLSWPWARTALGEPGKSIQLGDSFRDVLERYGFPDELRALPPDEWVVAATLVGGGGAPAPAPAAGAPGGMGGPPGAMGPGMAGPTGPGGAMPPGPSGYGMLGEEGRVQELQGGIVAAPPPMVPTPEMGVTPSEVVGPMGPGGPPSGMMGMPPEAMGMPPGAAPPGMAPPETAPTAVAPPAPTDPLGQALTFGRQQSRATSALRTLLRQTPRTAKYYRQLEQLVIKALERERIPWAIIRKIIASMLWIGRQYPLSRWNELREPVKPAVPPYLIARYHITNNIAFGLADMKVRQICIVLKD
ncbi:MAG TPA: hypothetical protein EYP65_05815 [Armatimonadetes bacterium]|nr:hypothetical protein [Armatimonadota bacterium]